MSERILIIHGHPDPTMPHFCTALAQAYAEGAQTAGRAVRHVDLAKLDFPLLRSKAEWESGPLPPSCRIPDHNISPRSWKLAVARESMVKLLAALQATAS